MKSIAVAILEVLAVATEKTVAEVTATTIVTAAYNTNCAMFLVSTLKRCDTQEHNDTSENVHVCDSAI